MEKYRIDISDYVEAMIIEDMSELIIPIMEGTILTIDIIRAVSYTHLDVYKRQG